MLSLAADAKAVRHAGGLYLIQSPEIIDSLSTERNKLLAMDPVPNEGTVESVKVTVEGEPIELSFPQTQVSVFEGTQASTAPVAISVSPAGALSAAAPSTGATPAASASGSGSAQTVSPTRHLTTNANPAVAFAENLNALKDTLTTLRNIFVVLDRSIAARRVNSAAVTGADDVAATASGSGGEAVNDDTDDPRNKGEGKSKSKSKGKGKGKGKALPEDMV